MIEYILLGLVILALIVDKILYTKSTQKHIESLTKAVIAKNATDFAVAEKIENEPDKEEEPPEFKPTENMNDGEFNKYVLGSKEENGGNS
jgi:hypothetical protein